MAGTKRIVCVLLVVLAACSASFATGDTDGMPVGVTVDSYSSLIVTQPITPMPHVTAAMIAGGKKNISASGWFEVTTNDDVTLRTLQMITLVGPQPVGTNSYDFNASVSLLIGSGPSVVPVIDSDPYWTAELSRGQIYSGTVAVSFNNYDWTYNDLAGTYTGSVLLEVTKP